MAPDPPKPLYSTRADDPEVEERIDRFVVTLGETVDDLQDAEAAGSLEDLAERARALAASAEELGYAPLTEVAARIVAACGERNPEAARKGVVEATELAQRIRRGHRSAA